MKKKVFSTLILLSCVLYLGWAQDGATAEGTQRENSENTENGVVFDDEESYLIRGENEAVPQGAGESFLSVWDILRMVLILGAVIALIYGLFHFLKKAGGGRFTESEVIKLLGSRSLTAASSLHLVEVGTELFLVGAGEDQLNLIAKIEDKESLDTVRLTLSKEKPPQRGSFSDMLGELFHPSPKGEKGQKGGSAGEFLKEQRGKLKKL